MTEPTSSIAVQSPEQMLQVFGGISSFDAAQRMAKALSASTLVPSAYQGQNGLANSLIALEIAGRMRMSPLLVMQNLHIVQGKPSWSSQFLIATVNASGRFSPLRFVFDDQEAPTWCYAEGKDLSSGEVLRGERITLEMARAEGWSTKNGSKWQTMPGQMFRYRAAAFWVRAYCPEISLGLVTQEEAVDSEPVQQVQVAVEPPAPVVAPAAVAQQPAVTVTVEDARPPAAAEPAAPARSRRVATRQPVAPAPVITAEQATAIGNAMGRKLSPIGIETFLAELAVNGIAAVDEVPAAQLDRVMQLLASTEAVSNWNRGDSSAGDRLLDQERINEVVEEAAAVQEQQATFV